ncbi:MAG: tRNA lysidine(34) synthetase TilS [Pelagibacteraceae bacterium TMED216]|nr:MAG: tRNA lysidine(34) synthetase TilS [Pelagibacteraceae bacterium TMED216]|tara:strand:- start:5906 stop:6925 length:1020 start_codon:yes stop_codon:yes gene_type:complete
MSKRNLNVLNLKKFLKENSRESRSYISFKKNLKLLKKKPFLVAVSGGPDSLALAILSKIFSIESKIKVYYVLIDHKIRDKSSLEAEKVKKLLKKHHINLRIIKNKKIISSNIQKNARDIRYELLLNFCLKNKLKYVLTAHHSDDQVETFLIMLSRGSGVQGLSSMKIMTKLKKNIFVVRPLLDQKKIDLIYISKKLLGKYFVDPSNKDNKYLRTKVRNIKKFLEKKGIKQEQILRSINNLNSSRETINNYVKKVYSSNVIKEKQKYILNYKEILKETDEVKLKIFNNTIKSCSKSYYPPRSKKTLNLIRRISNGKEKKLTLGGCILSRKGRFIEVVKEA